MSWQLLSLDPFALGTPLGWWQYEPTFEQQYLKHRKRKLFFSCVGKMVHPAAKIPWEMMTFLECLLENIH